MNQYDKDHLKHLNAYLKQVERLYGRLSVKAALLRNQIKALSDNGILSLDDYPELRTQVNNLLKEYSNGIETIIVNGVRSEWTLANNKNNELSRKVFGPMVGRLAQTEYRKYFGNNYAARDAFLKRKENGMNLSERVWRQTLSFKYEIELGLDVGIRNGMPAAQMASELKQWLKEPNKLFRRVRNERGELELSKAAQDYHPGQGVYRSSYKNARRLTVTETNMAYRTADTERWQKASHVVGIEIVLSNNHTTTNSKGEKVVLEDICDELQGKYPKDFVFRGWHPHCRCHAVPIMKTDAELEADTKRILQGKAPTDASTSANYVKNTPDNFNSWLETNRERLEEATSKPYFMTDNPNFFE